MRLFLIAAWLLVLFTSVSCTRPIAPDLFGPQTVWQGEPAEGLVRYRVEGYDDVPHRWGYRDTSGKTVIEPTFLEAGDFADGLARVRFYGKHKQRPGNYYPSHEHPVGYINHAGDIVIPPQFNYAQQFSEGLAEFTDASRKRGYLDTQGNIVIPAQYDDADAFAEGYAFVRPDRDTRYSEEYISQEEADLRNRASGATPNSKFYVWPGVHSRAIDIGRWGIIDRQGRLVIEPRYDQVGSSFKNGRARVMLEGEWIVIDPHGQVLQNDTQAASPGR